jgi:hypothetical protein
MLGRVVSIGLLLAASGCAGSAAYPPSSESTGAGSGGSGASTGGGTTSGGGVTTSGGTGSTSGISVPLGATLTGPLAFPASFVGEFYGQLPDGGPDLSNLDCLISDGDDMGALCAPPKDLDGGATSSHRILNVFVTSVDATPLGKGTAEVMQYYDTDDAGVFATIELTYLGADGGLRTELALSGQVAYTVDSNGMSGQFEALFPDVADAGGTLGGTFGASYCGLLNY